MDELTVGVIPVCDGDELVGMVTDRDIVVRGVAQDCDMKTTKLADVMSTNVRCATEDQDVDEILGQMAGSQIRRMPVVDGNKRLVGIVTLGDIADKNPGDEMDVANSLAEISSPSQPDRSSRQASGPAGGGASGGKARK
jgi:CBS-domain-containing membrane protein